MIAFKFWLFCDWFYRQISSLIEGVILTPGTNLTILEWAVLMRLYQKDGQNASNLAISVNRAPTSFTPLLDKLEAKGYIERSLDSTDRRGTKIHLTKDGFEVRRTIVRKNREIVKTLKLFLTSNQKLERTAVMLVSKIRR